MFKNLKKFKSVPLVLSITLITNSALFTNVYAADSTQKTEIELKSENNTVDQNKNELIVNLLYPSIKNQINSYYKDYFNINLEVFSYENSLVNVKKDTYSEVTVDVVPQIGPHNPVGIDRITFTVGIFGEPKLKNYEHLKSYKIPEIYKDYIIKPLPNIEK